MDSIAEHLIANHLSQDFTCLAQAATLTRTGTVMPWRGQPCLAESETHAAQRGAQPYAELLGYAMTTDTRLIVAQNRGDGVALAQAAVALDKATADQKMLLDVGDG
jgi:3-oxoacyl-(acyl-carrier-protein) synthase